MESIAESQKTYLFYIKHVDVFTTFIKNPNVNVRKRAT